MAGKIYLGKSNTAHNGTKGLIGVGMTARTLKKIYFGVANKARLVYTNYVAVTGFSLRVSNKEVTGETRTEDQEKYNVAWSESLVRAVITPSDATDQTVTWKYTGKTSCGGLSVRIIPDGNICTVSGIYDSRNGLAVGQILGILAATLPDGKNYSMYVKCTNSSFASESYSTLCNAVEVS